MSGNRRSTKLLLLLLALVFLLTACNQGMPSQDGEHPLKPHSLTWDGKQYEFSWVDPSGAIKTARGDDVQLVQDTRSYLEMRGGKPIVHLAPDDPVTVLGRDNSGDFTSMWFPFMLGSMIGGRDRTVVVGQPYPGTSQVPNDRASYRYPPTDGFGRGDSLHGSVTNSQPASPDYRKVKPIPDAISGQSGGTGGGSAASSKSATVGSGQAGGSGAGSAATSKGGFRAADNSGSAATSKGVSGAKSGSGQSLGGAGSKAPSAPKVPKGRR